MPDSLFKLSQYVVSTPIYDERDGYEKHIVYGTRNGVVRIMDPHIWNSVNEGLLQGIPRSIIDDLISTRILVPKNENELLSILNENQAEILDSDDLYMVIQPTALCQLGCGYCGQKHTAKNLSQKHQDLLVEELQKRLSARKWKSVLISWFGAEALLALDDMRLLTKRFKELAQQFGCSYSGRLTSNGVLVTKEVARELYDELDITEVHITLDGTKEYHDKSRPTKGGQGSFDKIFNNIITICESQDIKLKIIIRCNVSWENMDGVIPLMRLLAEHNLQKRLGSFYWTLVYSWGNDADKTSPTQAEFGEREMEWYVEMYKLGFNVNVLPKRKKVTCFAVDPKAILIDATGTLFDCSEVSQVPAYEKIPGISQSNKYAIGHLEHGEIPGKRKQNVFGDFYSLVEKGQVPCNTCRMLPVCGGACPKKWLEGYIPCPVTKFNIEQKLLLHYAISRMKQEETVVSQELSIHENTITKNTASI